METKYILNGSTQKLVGYFNEEDKEKTVQQLEQIYPDVSIDCDGDIVVFEEE